MSTTVCLAASTLEYPEGGGHLWVYLNWALGLRALGCRVIWLEAAAPEMPVEQVQALLAGLKDRLARYGLADAVALCSQSRTPLPRGASEGCLDLDAAAEADLVLNLSYASSPEIIQRFRRSAMIDIDPGLLQVWMSEGLMALPRHDVYFTISEVVGQPGACFPDGGLKWQYTPPCVALDWWPPCPAAADAPFTTLSHWF